MKSGILIIDKERDMTSRDVVNIACKKLGTKKIGHTGTLDPIATGVLVLGVNEGTKIIDLLTSNDKLYQAEVEIGVLTDTLDITGEVIEKKDVVVTKEELGEALTSFKGKYMQEVPKYSAVRVNGKRLYDYARNDMEVKLPKREVEIKDISLIDFKDNKFTFKVHVSKGTYIRSLIRDIGDKLNIPMTMTNLRRIKQGIFDISDAIKIDDISNEKLISIKDALSNYSKIEVDEITEKKVKNGCKLNQKIDDITLVLNKNNDLLALYEPSNHIDIMKPYKVFKGVENEED